MRLKNRIGRLESATRTEGGGNRVIDGFRYIGGPGGYLRIPVIDPAEWSHILVQT